MSSRKLGPAGLVMLVALGLSTSPANAEPLSMEFSEARANVGVQLDDASLLEAPDSAPFGAALDPGSGAITSGDLQMPEFSTFITDPIDADVAVDFELGVITGSYTEANGALTLSGEAGGTLSSEGKECTVSTAPAVLTLSTSKNSGGAHPREGEYFTSGLTGSGAIAGRWTDMTATPAIPGVDVLFCEDVDERIGGPGGIWMKQGGLEPTPPAPCQCTPPRKPDVPPPPPSPPACVVPKLTGKTLARAKAKLRAANCRLGKVGIPKGKGSNLVVKSFSPTAGETPANGMVHVRLGPKHRRTGS
jgi:hypothetical protein